MKSASATRIAAQFNDYLKASREQPVLITRNGKPVAVLLGVHNVAVVLGQKPRQRSHDARSIRANDGQNASYHGLATTWIAIGRPLAGSVPAGVVTAGHPVRLAGSV